MEKSWNEIGKQMPYRVPTGFFARQEQTILARTVRARRARILRLRLIGGIAACVALIALVGWWPSDRRLADHTLYAYAASMGDDEVEAWVEFYEADLFLSAELSEE